MLPDFTKAKENVSEMLLSMLSKRAREYKGEIAPKEYRIFEGCELSTITDNGKELLTRPKEISGKVSIKTEDIQSGNPLKVLHLIDQMALQMAQEQSKMMFTELGKICTEANQKIDFKGAKFNPDMLLQIMEKILIEFDADGNMKNLMFVVGPQMADRVKDEMEKADKDPEFRKKHEALMARKRGEWRAREASRKLVG